MTTTFPEHERFGLTQQMRRAACSIPSNIAEGTRQATGRAKRHFFRLANASQAELETWLEIARRRGYASEAELRAVEALATRTSMMLFKLTDSVRD